jgi:hypothetical protein
VTGGRSLPAQECGLNGVLSIHDPATGAIGELRTLLALS